MQKRLTAALLAIPVVPGALFVGTGSVLTQATPKPAARTATDVPDAAGLARRFEQLRC